jgi:hypothetical protein
MNRYSETLLGEVDRCERDDDTIGQVYIAVNIAPQFENKIQIPHPKISVYFLMFLARLCAVSCI